MSISKRLNAVLLLVAFIFSMYSSFGITDECKKEIKFVANSKLYYVNGSPQKEMDAAPQIKKGRLYLLVRYVAEAAGAKVSWDGNTKTVTIVRSDNVEITMTVGTPTAKVGGVVTQVGSETEKISPFVSSGRVYCPLRFTAQSLGADDNDIAWDSGTSTATIKFDDPDCTGDTSIEDIVPPKGFVLVSACPKLGINEPFYVSKYEMKIKGQKDGNVEYSSSYEAESRPDGTPWIGMTMLQAKAECEALGQGYSLITNSEWMAIARDIESVAKNWSDGKTHLTGQSKAKLNIGNVCRYGPRGNGGRIDKSKNEKYYGEGALEASSDDSLGCFGYKSYDTGKWGKVVRPELDSNGWNLYRRTFYLTNGSVLWDFGGNVWSWTDFFVPKAKDRARIDGHVDECYLEVNACNTFSDKMKPEHIQSLNPDIADVTRYTGKNYYPKGEDKFGVVVDQYTNQNCLGRFHPTSRNDDAGLAMRGTSYMHGDAMAGIYSVAMGYNQNPDHIECEVGFRCVWRPKKK